MEEVSESRGFWEFVPRQTMPRAFLMSGKRREDGEAERDTDMDDEGSMSSIHSGNKLSPNTSFSDDNDADYARNHSSAFCPSSSSAFSKIENHRSDTEPDETGTAKSPFSPSNSGMPGFPGFYPSFYSPFLTSQLLSVSTDATPTSSASSNVTSPFFYPGMPMPSAEQQKRLEESPEKNMFYYVDPRIPFTNYFLNLTKLLNGSSKDYTAATTPLGKMAGEDARADDREHPISPLSTKSSPGKQPAETISSPPESFKFSAEKMENDSKDPKDLFKQDLEKHDFKTSAFPDKLSIPSFPDPRLMNPFSGSLMQSATHPASMIPMSSAGLFHPAFMHLPGTSLRRYNPEKPPPVKKYKCDVCGKAFSRSNTLVTHKRIHTGDKPFKCEICSRAFRQPGNLTRHRLTHTTVKPYVCPTCNKAFNRASNLHTHMRTHTSFKAFVCPYCGKGFHQKIDMKIHCYTHTAHTARSEAAI